MTENQFPDPFTEASGHAVRASKQMAYVTAIFVAAGLKQLAKAQREKELRDEQEKKAAVDREKAERDAVRAQWAPALDRQWLRSADPVELADTWSVAVPYADPDSDLYERSAELAVDNCESRLRELHPYAMNHYARLRSEGMGRLEAMKEAAPLFLNHPNARPHEYSERLAIDVQGLGNPWIDEVHGPSREGFEQHVARQQTARGSRIVKDRQARALVEGRPLLDPEEQRIVLEQATNLPPEIIGQVVPAASSSPSRPARRPWENESLFSIEEVVAIAARSPGELVSPPTAPAPVPAPLRQQRRIPHA